VLCDALGVQKHEVIGRHFGKFVLPESAEAMLQYFLAAFRGHPPDQAFEYKFPRRDGSIGVADLSVALVQRKDGKLVGTRGIIRDVTARKQAEEALEQATQAAEEASRAKSTFLTNVSHELRTPLTSVLGFAKLIRRRLTDGVAPALAGADANAQRVFRQVSDDADVIVAEGQRLTALINDVLELVTIEAGRVEWHMQPVMVGEIIARALAATASLSDAKGLAVQAEIEKALPTVVGDPDRLLQVVTNLLSNAIKFTDRGSVTCRARRANGVIQFSVSDTGTGIATEDLGKVFEHFVQMADPLADKPTGSGFRLPICKQIIEHHGGRIWVESALGRGSTFTFTLPAEGRESVPHPEIVPDCPRHGTSRQSGS